MKRSNTAIILILNDHMITYRVTDGVVSVPFKECVRAEPAVKTTDAWVKVPDIVSAMWVVGKLST